MIAAITGGEIEITGARSRDLEVIVAPLLRMGLSCQYDADRFSISPSTLHAASRITTGLWPGFPSDMVSLVTVLATQAAGRTLVHDWLYELRLFALEQLSAMRADFFLCDPHRIIVTGRTRLRGRALDTRDLRSGMALIAAALAAEGESRVSPLETVERGYATLVERYRPGAQVERVDGDIELQVMETLVHDVRYALRVLRKAPVFTVVVLLTIALGVGANAAVFAVVHAALLRALPYPDADRLVVATDQAPALFLDWQREAASFSAMCALTDAAFDVAGTDKPERITGAVVTAGFSMWWA